MVAQDIPLIRQTTLQPPSSGPSLALLMVHGQTYLHELEVSETKLSNL